MVIDGQTDNPFVHVFSKNPQNRVKIFFLIVVNKHKKCEKK